MAYKYLVIEQKLTQRVGTSDERLTWRGANRWSCWRQDVASACTSGSWCSCMIAQAQRNELRAMHTEAVLPVYKTIITKQIYIHFTVILNSNETTYRRDSLAARHRPGQEVKGGSLLNTSVYDLTLGRGACISLV